MRFNKIATLFYETTDEEKKIISQLFTMVHTRQFMLADDVISNAFKLHIEKTAKSLKRDNMISNWKTAFDNITKNTDIATAVKDVQQKLETAGFIPENPQEIEEVSNRLQEIGRQFCDDPLKVKAELLADLYACCTSKEAFFLTRAISTC